MMKNWCELLSDLWLNMGTSLKWPKIFLFASYPHLFSFIDPEMSIYFISHILCGTLVPLDPSEWYKSYHVGYVLPCSTFVFYTLNTSSSVRNRATLRYYKSLMQYMCILVFLFIRRTNTLILLQHSHICIEWLHYYAI